MTFSPTMRQTYFLKSIFSSITLKNYWITFCFSYFKHYLFIYFSYNYYRKYTSFGPKRFYHKFTLKIRVAPTLDLNVSLCKNMFKNYFRKKHQNVRPIFEQHLAASKRWMFWLRFWNKIHPWRPLTWFLVSIDRKHTDRSV